jgi:hypothetical protein
MILGTNTQGNGKVHVGLFPLFILYIIYRESVSVSPFLIQSTIELHQDDHRERIDGPPYRNCFP